MNKATGGECGSCRKTLAYITWKNGKRLLIVGCVSCQMEIRFDLTTMLDILGEEEHDRITQMLDEFRPVGLPH